MDELDLERKRSELELDRDNKKWKIRRRLAISAFVLNNLLGLIYLLFSGLLNSEIVKNLSDFNTIVITLMGSNSSIILLYIGAATYSDSIGQKVTK